MKVYKIVARDEWADAVRIGRYVGSEDDQRDGFIHLSLSGQVAGTLRKHFAKRDDLLLVQLDAQRLGPALHFEAAGEGEDFPHLYTSLDPALAEAEWELSLDASGDHVLPDALTA